MNDGYGKLVSRFPHPSSTMDLTRLSHPLFHLELVLPALIPHTPTLLQAGQAVPPLPRMPTPHHRPSHCHQ